MTVLKLNRVVLSYEGQVGLGFTLYDQTIILACHDVRVPRHFSIVVVWYVATAARKGPEGPALASQGVPAATKVEWPGISRSVPVTQLAWLRHC